ncbi:hypothetical protein ACFFP0_02770 [Rhizobium puerariae]|uniref:Secreted protein n=1 Tax=Rhizobium puerariae TaxID=1585791 RepID=A0ABV6AAW7_9HYPH
MRGRLLSTAVSLAALSTTAIADPLPIKGSYGNKEGCAYAGTGESPSSDDFFLLTPEAMTTAAAYCEIRKVLAVEGRNFIATVSCQAEGEEGESEDTAKVTFSSRGYTIGLASDHDIQWGPLPLCR